MRSETVLYKEKEMLFLEPYRVESRNRLYLELFNVLDRYRHLSDHDKWHVLNLVRYKFVEVNKK